MVATKLATAALLLHVDTSYTIVNRKLKCLANK